MKFKVGDRVRVAATCIYTKHVGLRGIIISGDSPNFHLYLYVRFNSIPTSWDSYNENELEFDNDLVDLVNFKQRKEAQNAKQ